MRNVWRWVLLSGSLGLIASFALLAVVGTPFLESSQPAAGAPMAGYAPPEARSLTATGDFAIVSAAQDQDTTPVPLNGVSLGDTVGFLAKFGFVLLLLYGSLRLLRNVTLRWQGLTPSTAQIAVLETRYLAPRRALYLVRAGSKVLLLGATDQQISLLADLTSNGLEEPPAEELVSLDSEEMRFQMAVEGK